MIGGSEWTNDAARDVVGNDDAHFGSNGFLRQ